MPKETNKQTKLSGTTKKKTTKSSTTKATKPKVPLKINTSKLKVGMTVKNYKELCELLKQEVTTGNAKKYQLKAFEAAHPAFQNAYFTSDARTTYVFSFAVDNRSSKPAATRSVEKTMLF